MLFVSNREESRKGMVQNEILEELLGALRSDDALTVLNEEAKNAGLKEKDEKAEKEVRREVARMLKLFGFSVSEEAGAAAAPSGRRRGSCGITLKPRPQPKPVPPNDPPTFIEILGR